MEMSRLLLSTCELLGIHPRELERPAGGRPLETQADLSDLLQGWLPGLVGMQVSIPDPRAAAPAPEQWRPFRR